MLKLYLAGPMSGMPDNNYPAFAAETIRLRGLGYEVVSPAEINPEGGTWHKCMRRDMEQMVRCDEVATLPGWDKSQGATLEVYVAGRLGIESKPASTYTGAQVQTCSSL